MNKLILCEGKTDAILLSYYLERICGWTFTKVAPKGAQIIADEKAQESVSWYKRNDDRLLICAVGSKSRFKAFFEAKILRPLIDADAFSKIAIIVDRDDETVSDIEENFRINLPIIAGNVKDGTWVDQEYINRYTETKQISVLLKVVPHNQQGALETLMLAAISEDPYDKNIVDKSRAFVDEVAPEAARYIGKPRLVSKAYLGVTWAVQSPQKVFDFIDQQIRQVHWETSAVLAECFKQVIEI